MGDASAPTIDDAATTAVEHKGAGGPVDTSVAARVGGHLGADFSGVRVHDDPRAREASAAMGARAFAYGGDVFLGPGESGADLGLMAHELTHVDLSGRDPGQHRRAARRVGGRSGGRQPRSHPRPGHQRLADADRRPAYPHPAPMSLRVAAATLAIAACDPRPARTPPPTVPADSAQEAAVSATDDPTARYHAFLDRMREGAAAANAIEYTGLAAAGVHCFALPVDGGLRQKACVTATGVVRTGANPADDWVGLLDAAPDAATAGRWIAWLETDETPSYHAPRIPIPVEVVTPADTARLGYAAAHAAKVSAPRLERAAGTATLTAWFHFPGAQVPERWIVRRGPSGAAIERRSAIELP